MHTSDPDPAANNRSDLEWFDKSNYTRIVGKDNVRYVHSTAGRVLGKSETSWEKRWKERQEAHPNDAYHPFPSLAQWKLAYWLSTCKASQSKIDEFLAIEGVRTHIPVLDSVLTFVPSDLVRNAVLSERCRTF